MKKTALTIARRPALLLAAALFLLAAGPGPVRADIYRYVDEKGVVHFSNMPDKPQYSIYMKEDTGRRAPEAVDTDAFDNLIEEAAAATGVDFDLIKAVMKVESNFNPKAVSVDGAKGLMQVMPSNFEALGITDPFEPRQNIRAGAEILAELLKSYDGSVSLTLAAYNAGLVAVKNHKAIPPYKETQDFVAKVMGEYKKQKVGREGRAVWRRSGEKPKAGPVTAKSAVEKKPAVEKKAADPKSAAGNTASARAGSETIPEQDGRQAHIITLTPDGIRETITLRFDE